jgi:hypothetical protein
MTSEENIARFAAGGTPLDEAFARTVSAVLANLRRWSAECLGSTAPAAPPEIEAELVQLAFLATDTIRIVGNERERAADFLWLLATVVASGHAALKEALSVLLDKHIGHPSVRERFVRVNAYLDEIAARADGVITARWALERGELGYLAARTDALVEKNSQDFKDFTELEELKEKRSDVVKSLIKLSDAAQLVEPLLLDGLAAHGSPAGRLLVDAHGRAVTPVDLRSRNGRNAEETNAIARQELEKLRLLIAHLAAISRRGFADTGAAAAQQTKEPGPRGPHTADGVAVATLPTAELHERLCAAVRTVAATLRDARGKIEGVRRRPMKNELQQAVNTLYEKTKKAVEACDGAALDASDALRTTHDSGQVLQVLRGIMAAHTGVVTRMNMVKLTPAEKLPVATMLQTMRQRLGEDIRSIEVLGDELAGRAAGATPAEAAGGEDAAGAPDAGDAGDASDALHVPDAPDVADVADVAAAGALESPDETVAAPAKTAAAAVPRSPADVRIAGLAAVANKALQAVKTLLAALNKALAHPGEGQVPHVAAAALKSGILEARDLVTAKLLDLRALAVAAGIAVDEPVGKFDRWLAQLDALEGETERLLKALAEVAAAYQTVRAAAAIEKGIADALNVRSTEAGRGGSFVPVRRRCDDALATLAEMFGGLRQAQDRLAAARGGEWSLLRAAPVFVDRLRAGAAGAEGALREIHARVEATCRSFKLDRPGPEP